MLALSYDIIRSEGSSLLWLSRRPIQSLWLHPEIERRLNPDFSYRQLRNAISAGYLMECERRPWTHLSAIAQERLLGNYVSSKSGKILKAGPKKHEAMIHRALLSAKPFINQATIEFDESIKATSLPGAWGASTQISPDIYIRPNVKWLPSIWIECERTLKTTAEYVKRFEKIPKNTLIVYAFCSHEKRGKFERRILGSGGTRHIYAYLESDLIFVLRAWAKKFQIFSELSGQKFL